MRTPPSPLRVLVVDDEAPQRGELVYLLQSMPEIGFVFDAADSEEALRALHHSPFDVVLLDIGLPGLSGIELARVFARFTDPPALVFITAHEQYALDAFEVRAVDYLLKPIRPERLAVALARAAQQRSSSAPDGRDAAAPPTGTGASTPGPEEVAGFERLPVEASGKTRFVTRAEVLLVEACGDYSRLHTTTGNHLVRTALTALEAAWEAHGFLRVHRGYLVAVAAIEEVSAETGRGYTVRVAGRNVPVSRRHTREFRERVLRPPDDRFRP